MDSDQKHEIMKRLEAEGRWPEAAAWKNTRIKELRVEGLLRPKASSQAWSELTAKFPPLPDLLSVPEEHTTTDLAAAPTDESDRPMPRGRVSGLDAIPAEWGELPASAPLKLEVQWVRSNRLLVVTESPSGSVRVSLAKAKEPAPSRSTLDLLESAILNRAKFLELSFRVIGGDGDDESETVRRERSSLAEMESLLDQMGEQFAAEMAADAPQAVRESAERVVDDWIREFGIDESHRNALVGRACRLATDCVEAALDASGRD